MATDLITHLLVTTRFLIKGTVRTGGRRMQDLLQSSGVTFLILERATLWELEGPRKYEVGTAMVRRDQVVLAHEYVDLAGDDSARQLTAPAERNKVAVLLTEPTGWELRGEVMEAELQPQRAEEVFVLTDPVAASVPMSGAAREEQGALTGLSYLIVHRLHVHGWLGHE